MVRRRNHSNGTAAVIPPGELRHADLSHLRLQDMTPDQRAELRRRYDYFVKHFGAARAATPPAPKSTARVRKWVPGTKH
jgi:hypothetical protein